jgi:hypothetical protein
LREEGALQETLRIGVKSDEGSLEVVSEADLNVDGVEKASKRCYECSPAVASICS